MKNRIQHNYVVDLFDISLMTVALILLFLGLDFSLSSIVCLMQCGSGSLRLLRQADHASRIQWINLIIHLLHVVFNLLLNFYSWLP